MTYKMIINLKENYYLQALEIRSKQSFYFQLYEKKIYIE